MKLHIIWYDMLCHAKWQIMKMYRIDHWYECGTFWDKMFISYNVIWCYMTSQMTWYNMTYDITGHLLWHDKLIKHQLALGLVWDPWWYNHVLIWYDMLWHDKIWLYMVWHYLIWLAIIWHVLTWYFLIVWHDMTMKLLHLITSNIIGQNWMCYDMTWHNMTGQDMTWKYMLSNDKTWHPMTWHDYMIGLIKREFGLSFC